jgi:hypothetical protein
MSVSSDPLASVTLMGQTKCHAIDETRNTKPEAKDWQRKKKNSVKF